MPICAFSPSVYTRLQPFFCCRLVEEVKLRASQLQLQNEDVYMAATFQEFIQMCVRKLRGEDAEEELDVDYVRV